jgi:hypothetical protein
VKSKRRPVYSGAADDLAGAAEKQAGLAFPQKLQDGISVAASSRAKCPQSSTSSLLFGSPLSRPARQKRISHTPTTASTVSWSEPTRPMASAFLYHDADVASRTTSNAVNLGFRWNF